MIVQQREHGAATYRFMISAEEAIDVVTGSEAVALARKLGLGGHALADVILQAADGRNEVIAVNEAVATEEGTGEQAIRWVGRYTRAYSNVSGLNYVHERAVREKLDATVRQVIADVACWLSGGMPCSDPGWQSMAGRG
jgi:hypothetical protein